MVEMTTALELVYEYRHLMGKCTTGVGLDMDEIQAVDTIEALFAEARGGTSDLVTGREALAAVMRSEGGRVSDRVDVLSLRPDEFVVRGCFWLDSGAPVELRFDDDELLLSYRFRGRVIRTTDETGGLLTAHIRLIGVPVLVRRGPRSEASIAAGRAAARRRAERASALVAA